MRGLYIGKFDPFHLGHLKVFQLVKGLVKDVKIGLGAQRRENYFAIEEKKEMVI